MTKTPRANYILAGSAAVVTFLVYIRSLRNDFINLDDVQYVIENPFIRSLNWQLLKSAFTESHAGNWHPLSWLSHALDYSVWGLNPLGHHLTSNILHALNTFLVVILVIRLLEVYRGAAGDNRLSRPCPDDLTAMIIGGATGLLFGLHPLHVESVVWATERKDLLCTFFYLLSVLSYTGYVADLRNNNTANSAAHSSNGKYLSSIGFFLLSLLSKPISVTLPLVLLILDFHPFRRMESVRAFWIMLKEKFPFFVLSFLASVLTVFVQRGAISSLNAVPFSDRVLVAAKSLVFYLWKMMVPMDLVPFYPFPSNVSLLSSDYLAGIVLVPAATIAALLAAKRQRLWIAVWGYYVITLLPVIGIIQVGRQAMADRWTYLSSLGPFLLMGLMAAKLYEKASGMERGRAVSMTTSLLVALAIFFFMAWATVSQIGIWQNSATFWTYVIKKRPSSFDAHVGLGSAYATKGLFDMAIEQYRTALRLNPNSVDAHYNLGNAYAARRLFDMAVEQYQAALKLNPNFAEAHFNLGVIYLNNGSKDMARASFEMGLRIRPNDHRARQILYSIMSK